MSTATLEREIPAALAGKITPDLFKKEDLDGSRWYYHPVSNEELISVTTFLSGTLSKAHLPGWAARVATEFTINNLDVIAELLAEGYAIKEIIDLIKGEAERIRGLRAEIGSLVHAVVEALILWARTADGRGADIQLPEIPPHLADVDMDGTPLWRLVEGMQDAFLKFVKKFNLGPKNFVAAEMTVYNLDFGIAGTLDMILRLYDVAIGPDGKLYGKPGAVLVLCVDIKTGKNMDATWPAQLASYRRMTEALVNGVIHPMPETEASAVLWLRDGRYRLLLITGDDDAEGWNQARSSLQTYEGWQRAKRKPGQCVYMPLADGSPAPTLLCDLFAEGYDRAPTALFKAGVKNIKDLARHCVESLLELRGVGDATIPLARKILSDNGYDLPELGSNYRPRFTALEQTTLLATLDGPGYAPVAKKLAGLGILTVGQLANLTESEVNALAGIGAKAFDKAWLMLADHDLYFDTVLDRLGRSTLAATHGKAAA